MDIYQSVNNVDNNLEFSNEISNIINCGIKKIRVNLCKYDFIEMQKKIVDIVDNLIDIAGINEIAFDLPYPLNKSRVKRVNLVNNQVRKGKKYYIRKLSQYRYYIEDTIFVDTEKFDKEFLCRKKLYYNDGLGAFRIIDVSSEKITVIAENDFEIKSTSKSILCGYTSNEKVCFDIIDYISKKFWKCKITFLLSFVSNKEEVSAVKQLVGENYSIYAKIEKYIDNKELEEVIKEADGIVVARGDMILIWPLENILEVCRSIISYALVYGKKVIIATDVCESLRNRIIPLRSEVFDLCLIRQMGCSGIILSQGMTNENSVDFLMSFFQKGKKN